MADERSTVGDAPGGSEAGTGEDFSRAGVLAGMQQLAPLGRRSIELACFGGLGVDAIAELVEAGAPEVRRAMREGLLQLGALAPRLPEPARAQTPVPGASR